MKNANIVRRLGSAVVTGVYAVLTACGDGTEPLVPSAVQVAGGDQQAAAAGSPVPVAPSVKVVSSSGKPVPNVRVTFVPAAQSGVVVGGTQVTNATGVATATSWTLGTLAGVNTLNVTAEGLPAITMTATTRAGTPTAASIAAGAGQSAMVATAVTTAPSVRVLDVYGNPVPDVPVTFSVQSGSIERPTTQTDASGVASGGRWTLGNRSGTQILTATVGSLSPLPIGATAIAEAATQMVIARQPSTDNASGDLLSTQPIVEFRDRFDNVATTSTLSVTASLASGNGTLAGTVTKNAAAGRATFTDLKFTGTGAGQLQFVANGFQSATSAAFNVFATARCAGTDLVLDYTLGQMGRFATTAAGAPRCLSFSAARNAGQEYLVLFESMATRGPSNALFPGAANQNDGPLTVDVLTRGPSGSILTGPAVATARRAAAPANAVHGWDFGGAPIYEIEPPARPGIKPAAMVLRNGAMVNANAVNADINVGDTLLVQFESIRPSIPTGMYKAIVRLVTPDIVISEDLRIFSGDSTFTRAGGGLNTPMTQADMQAMADDYSQNARPQGDRFFGGHNTATSGHPGRPIAVHSLMFADNVWGYTYSVTNYFVWDYWVQTDGKTKTLAQHPQRVADNLFMHEIAHMRHMGLMERAGLGSANRGHTWVTEGFARYTERLPIAARLLGALDPARNANVTLPINPAFAPNYYYGDVPGFLESTASMYGGYAASAYLFDYFADQVALAGGNWSAAVADLLINLGAENTANATDAKYLPGLDLATLFTRARIALFTDDYTAGLPAWTQYTMYNLRASRPVTANTFFLDPRNGFPRIKAGQAFTDSRQIAGGGAFGYVIDGNNATTDFRVDFTPASVTNGVVTVVRIK